MQILLPGRSKLLRASHLNPTESLSIARDPAVEGFSDALTVFSRAQLALVGWIAHKGNLREDRGHIRADEHNKGRLLHSTVFDSRTLRCLACMKRLLYVGG